HPPRPAPHAPVAERLRPVVHPPRGGRAPDRALPTPPPPLTRRAFDLLTAAGVRPLLHQPRYSLFDRRPEAELFPLLRELQVGGAVFSPLAQGLLTAKYLDGTVPADSRAANSRFLNESALTDDYLTRIRGIAAVARDAGLTIPQLAVAWVLRDPVVTTAIVGASRTGQIDDALTASRATLASETIVAREQFAPAPGDAVA
ncbi:MAG TPA: aldo/keto reductase, partial [Arachnia sp.]|nr:aldo/keto reductase [Arachnia sp.]